MSFTICGATLDLRPRLRPIKNISQLHSIPFLRRYCTSPPSCYPTFPGGPHHSLHPATSDIDRERRIQLAQFRPLDEVFLVNQKVLRFETLRPEHKVEPIEWRRQDNVQVELLQ